MCGSIGKKYASEWTHAIQTFVAQESTRLVQKEEKMQQSQTSLLTRQGRGTERTVAHLMASSFAWASNVCSSRQNTHLLSLSVFRDGHMTYFRPMRLEQTSTQGSEKLHLLCFQTQPLKLQAHPVLLQKRVLHW